MVLRLVGVGLSMHESSEAGACKRILRFSLV
jgi:hypothetical protein